MHQNIIAEVSGNETQIYPTTEDWLKGAFAHIHTGKFDSSGKSILKRDGDEVIADALKNNSPVAPVHFTNVPLKDWEDKEIGTVKHYGDLSRESKDITRRGALGYSDTPGKRAKENHVWFSLNAADGLSWWVNHYLPFLQDDLCEGRFEYEETLDGITEFYVLHGWWLFPNNPAFHLFRQHRLDPMKTNTTTGIGANLGLFMKAMTNVTASAVSIPTKSLL